MAGWGRGSAGCGSGGMYFLGFIGSLVFYVQQASSFWGGVVGILKAFVWPAFVVYDLLVHVSG